LWAGIALLTVGAYFFGGIAGGGRVWWRHIPPYSDRRLEQQRRFLQRRSRTERGQGKVYGVLGQANDATRGDDAVAAASSGSTSLVDHVNAVNAGGIDVGTPNHFFIGASR